MVPRAFPGPRFLVYRTGVLEVLGAVGLLVPATRTFASFGLVLLLVAVFPANVDAARKEIPLRGKLPAPLWLRGSMQLLFIGMTLWVAPPRSDSPGVYMSMMRDLGGELPDEWLAKAQSCEAPRLRRLASGLKKDLSAVRGGLTEG
jgi:uncharacterized membrane protein